MSELGSENQEQAAEFDRERALAGVIDQYFPEDKEFLEGHDLDDRIAAVYGMLLEQGEDPDVVLADAGVIEGEENEFSAQ
jgi:hypothetical protein